MRKIKLYFLFLIFMIIKVNAVELIEENANLILTVTIQDKNGLGSFSLNLIYDPNKTEIINISAEEPFIVVYNIDNSNGIAKIAGYHGQIHGPSGKVRLAKIKFIGLSKFKIENIKLYNTQGKLLTQTTFVPVENVTTAEVPNATQPVGVPTTDTTTSKEVIPTATPLERNISAPIKENTITTKTTPASTPTQAINTTHTPIGIITKLDKNIKKSNKMYKIQGFTGSYFVLAIVISLLLMVRRRKK